MSEEIWKDIPGYEGHYQVSNFGNVKSILKSREKLLKPREINGGYVIVSLCTNHKVKTRTIHSLVMESFVGARPDNMEVCHNDGNPHNNRLDNLRYDTHKNNVIDTVKQNRQHSQKLSADDVLKIRKLLNDNNLTTADIATMYNVTIRTVQNIKARKNWGWLHED